MSDSPNATQTMKIALVGPIPPPAGGMARQAQQQCELLKDAGFTVAMLATNAPYKPSFIGKVPGVRAGFRLLGYLISLVKAFRQVDVIHIMANSGWSWHLFASPALLVAKLCNKPIILNYRGGEAAVFFQTQWRWVRPFIHMATTIIVPSGYLQQVFKPYQLDAAVIPNTLDNLVFSHQERKDRVGEELHLLVARNLEPIYDVGMAIDTFALVHKVYPHSRLTIAGTGPQLALLKQHVQTLGLNSHVTFVGRLEKHEMAAAYQSADILLNTSLVDNSPNSLIEALACGTCVVSSAVGGIPFLVTDGEDAMLVQEHTAKLYSDAILGLIANNDKCEKLRQQGIKSAARFDKSVVIKQWIHCYTQAMQSHNKKRGNRKTMTPLIDKIITALIANVLFPLHEWLKKHKTVAVFRQMEKRQWWSSSAIHSFQSDQLQQFIRDIYQHVPYYKKWMDDANITPSDIQSAKDLAKLPFLTKELIRQNTVALTTSKPHQLSKFNTGGSSGEPLIFYIGNERVSHDVAAKWRATRWWDVNIGDKEIVLWGSPIELGKQDKVKQIRDKMFRTRLISAFQLNEATKMAILNDIIKTKPPMLFGYPSVYFLLAEFAESHLIDLTRLGIKVIFVTSERLYDHQREKIEKAFNAPVANGYGGRDAGFIAHECPKGNMHTTADDIIVEIVDAQGHVLPHGESGEIVVTHLRTSEFPFVRYKTGDIGVVSDQQCTCGRGLPILREVQGRTTDFIVATDGTQMHGLALIYHVRDVPGVKNFKIVQESLEKTDLFIQVDESFDKGSLKDIENNFKKRLGEKVSIDIQIVTHIDSEKSGKYRYVISKVGG